jgi:hypothetical protein
MMAELTVKKSATAKRELRKMHRELERKYVGNSRCSVCTHQDKTVRILRDLSKNARDNTLYNPLSHKDWRLS